ncbi:MAG: hypothetical protein M1828_007080 [Chrysothrix sp. TS-e1954]|nr:MAG: hypothetical protein M1828_007080 [Chrysothrix sp. TS-e1954]
MEDEDAEYAAYIWRILRHEDSDEEEATEAAAATASGEDASHEPDKPLEMSAEDEDDDTSGSASMSLASVSEARSEPRDFPRNVPILCPNTIFAAATSSSFSFSFPPQERQRRALTELRGRITGFLNIWEWKHGVWRIRTRLSEQHVRYFLGRALATLEARSDGFYMVDFQADDLDCATGMTSLLLDTMGDGPCVGKGSLMDAWKISLVISSERLYSHGRASYIMSNSDEEMRDDSGAENDDDAENAISLDDVASPMPVFYNLSLRFREPPRRPFLSLPLKVRQNIYKALFALDEEGLPLNVRRMIRLKVSTNSSIFPSSEGDIPLLRTCKTIRAEAGKMAIGLIEFSTESSEDVAVAMTGPSQRLFAGVQYISVSLPYLFSPSTHPLPRLTKGSPINPSTGQRELDYHPWPRFCDQLSALEKPLKTLITNAEVLRIDDLRLCLDEMVNRIDEFLHAWLDVSQVESLVLRLLTSANHNQVMTYLGELFLEFQQRAMVEAAVDVSCRVESSLPSPPSFTPSTARACVLVKVGLGCERVTRRETWYLWGRMSRVAQDTFPRAYTAPPQDYEQPLWLLRHQQQGQRQSEREAWLLRLQRRQSEWAAWQKAQQ